MAPRKSKLFSRPEPPAAQSHETDEGSPVRQLVIDAINLLKGHGQWPQPDAVPAAKPGLATLRADWSGREDVSHCALTLGDLDFGNLGIAGAALNEGDVSSSRDFWYANRAEPQAFPTVTCNYDDSSCRQGTGAGSVVFVERSGEV